MSNAGYGNYVEDAPGPTTPDRAPSKPGGDEAEKSSPSAPQAGEHPGTPGDGASSKRPAGDEVDPGVG